jgi:hypothetical protein
MWQKQLMFHITHNKVGLWKQHGVLNKYLEVIKNLHLKIFFTFLRQQYFTTKTASLKKRRL